MVRSRWWTAPAAVTALASLILTSTLASCGSDDPPSGQAPTVTTTPAEAATDLLAAAAGSSLNGAPMPGGGFVAFGVADPDGRIRRDVVVFDASGVPTAAFELPDRMAPVSSVVAGGALHLYGYRCDDRPWENDVGEQQCTPGTHAGVSVDLASGAVTDLSAPDGSGSPQLLRIGDRAVGFVTWPDPAAWVLDAGRWGPIEVPPGTPCQVDDRIVVDLTDRTGLPSTSTITSEDLDDRFQLAPAIQVLDPTTLTWGDVRTGPPMTVSLMGLSGRCTAGRFTSVAVSGGPPVSGNVPVSTSTSFDLATSTWSEVVPLGNQDWSVYALAEAEVFLSIGPAARRVIDPVTGVASPPAQALPSAETQVLTITGTRALVFDPADPGDRLQVVDLVTD